MVLGRKSQTWSFPDESGRVIKTRRSAVISDTRGGGERIDEKVIVIASDFPHGESEQIVLDDEVSLGSEGLRVVVGNHQLFALVVNEGLRKRGKREKLNGGQVRADQAYGLTALVEPRQDSAGGGSVVV